MRRDPVGVVPARLRHGYRRRVRARSSGDPRPQDRPPPTEYTGPTDGLVADPQDELEPGPAPLWSSAGAVAPLRTGGSGKAGPPAPESAASGPRWLRRRRRSALLVALLVFYCLQLATALVAWREAPIRTEALVDPIVVYAVCAALLLPAFVLPGRWRVVPTVLATATGVLGPVVLARDLMEVVGPRDVWVGQSLTLQVLFPLVVGLFAVIALLTAPRCGHKRSLTTDNPRPGEER